VPPTSLIDQDNYGKRDNPRVEDAAPIKVKMITATQSDQANSTIGQALGGRSPQTRACRRSIEGLSELENHQKSV